MALQLPEGSAFPRTEAVAEGFLKKIQSLDGVQNVVTMMGFDTLGSDIKANAATFILQLKHWNERQQTADDYQQQLTKWLRESPDARGIAVLPAPIPGLGSSNGSLYCRLKDIHILNLPHSAALIDVTYCHNARLQQ